MPNKKREHKMPAYINVPFFLYQDKKLNKSEMLLASFIYSLHTAGKEIVANNEYLAELIGIDPRNIRDTLVKLEAKKYIQRIGFGSQRKILWIHTPKSNIVIVDDGSSNEDAVIPVEQILPNEDASILLTRMRASSLPGCQHPPYIKYNNKYNNKYNIHTREANENLDKPSAQSKPVIEQKKLKPVDYPETLYPMPEPSFKLVKENDEGFEEFWGLYPNKQNKRRARLLWVGNVLSNKKENIIAKLKDQIKNDVDWLKGYIPSAVNYLSDERWEDEVKLNRAKNQKSETKSYYDHESTDWINKKIPFLTK